MNESERNHLRDWVDDHLEAYVDGELPADQRRRLETFVREDAAAARRLALTRRVREALSAADRPACPPDVTRAVLGTARTDARAESRPPRRAEPRHARRGASRGRPGERSGLGTSRSALRRPALAAAWTAYLRPTLAAAALVLLVVASALVGRAPREAAPETASAQTPTSAEVDQALQEARWALAYVSDLGRRTGQSIRREVFQERVNDPVQRALESGLGTGLDAAHSALDTESNS